MSRRYRAARVGDGAHTSQVSTCRVRVHSNAPSGKINSPINRVVRKLPSSTRPIGTASPNRRTVVVLSAPPHVRHRFVRDRCCPSRFTVPTYFEIAGAASAGLRYATPI